MNLKQAKKNTRKLEKQIRDKELLAIELIKHDQLREHLSIAHAGVVEIMQQQRRPILKAEMPGRDDQHLRDIDGELYTPR